MSDPWVAALSLRSSTREKVLEHRFLAEVCSELWRLQCFDFSVARGEVDDGGFDVVFEVGDLIRHVQLKAKHIDGRAARYAIQTALTRKPSACVVVMVHDPKTLEIDHYRFFGGAPGEGLPDLGDREVRHTKGNALGQKAVRPALRNVPLGAFEKVESTVQLIPHLFGHHLAA